MRTFIISIIVVTTIGLVQAQNLEEVAERERAEKKAWLVEVDTFLTSQGTFFIERPVGYLLSDFPDRIVTPDGLYIEDEYFAWIPICVREPEYGKIYFVTNTNVMEWMHDDSVGVVLEMPMNHIVLPGLFGGSAIYPVRRYEETTDTHVFGGVVFFHQESSKWFYLQHLNGLAPCHVEVAHLVTHEYQVGVVLQLTGDGDTHFMTLILGTPELLKGVQGVPRF